MTFVKPPHLLMKKEKIELEMEAQKALIAYDEEFRRILAMIQYVGAYDEDRANYLIVDLVAIVSRQYAHLQKGVAPAPGTESDEGEDPRGVLFGHDNGDPPQDHLPPEPDSEEDEEDDDDDNDEDLLN